MLQPQPYSVCAPTIHTLHEHTSLKPMGLFVVVVIYFFNKIKYNKTKFYTSELDKTTNRKKKAQREGVRDLLIDTFRKPI